MNAGGWVSLNLTAHGRIAVDDDGDPIIEYCEGYDPCIEGFYYSSNKHPTYNFLGGIVVINGIDINMDYEFREYGCNLRCIRDVSF